MKKQTRYFAWGVEYGKLFADIYNYLDNNQAHYINKETLLNFMDTIEEKAIIDFDTEMSKLQGNYCETCNEVSDSVMDRGVGYFCEPCNVEYEITQGELDDIRRYEAFHRG